MAPSRGTTALRCTLLGLNKSYSRFLSTFTRAVLDPTRRTQIYVSRTHDPYLNLSIEHFLLQKSPTDSTMLFLYTNKPCIVVGRNQNPWVEVNLRLAQKGLEIRGNAYGVPISLVRRRSGGGTVFHDEGNVNYSVICPTSTFDRDKHVQMVVRALHRLGVSRAKVNERHDIILDPGEGPRHASQKPYKISGSAYKLTRLRSLHHGTCLLSSPNINNISRYLRSPAKPFIKARGVESVSSPIANANVSNEEFENAVIAEFGMMYDFIEPMFVTEEASEIPEVAKGLAEMRSLEWTYMQTPQFTFSSHETEGGPCPRPILPGFIPADVNLSFTARNGAITQAEISIAEETLDNSAMLNKRLHEIEDWESVIPQSLVDVRYGIAGWLNELFGTGACKG